MRRRWWGMALALCIGALVPAATASIQQIDDGGGGGGGGGPYIPPGKVEQSVLDNVNTLGTSDFFIWMATKADLTPAYALETKEEKGQWVYNTLVATADATQASVRAYLTSVGATYQPFYIANKILVRGGTLATVADVANRSDVEKITADHPFQLQEPQVPSPPPGILGIEPNISFVKANQVWGRGWTGQGTVLAGNDTGLDEDHPAIKAHYRGCLNPPTCTSEDHNYNWWDATHIYPLDPYDGHGHGTHTTGTMVGDDGAGNQIGMAPGAKTVHCKNMTNGGSGSDATFTECFQWDLAPWDLNHLNPRSDKAPDAINNSWGYWGGNAPQFEDEIAALRAAGIVVEVSAGNEGAYGCWSLRSPGDYRQALTTGSVQHNGGVLPGTITGFSSRGPSDLYPADRDIPDIMAPGESIRSSLPGNNYAYWSGTSMAGPHVTGLVGLMWSANPGLRGRVAETIQLITSTAARLTGQYGLNCGGNYTTGPNNDWGYGTIDSLAAALATRSNTCTLDLVANTHNCYLVPPIAFVVPLSGGKTVFKVNLNAAQTGYGRAVFDTLYGGAPSGWTINVGDSSTNNGFGGDGATQSNDSEMQIYGTTMSVYGSDATPAAVRNILNEYNAVSQGATLSLDISNQFLGWVRGDLRSNYIYALAGQPDTEGPVNWDIYAGFNRSIASPTRVGTGATRVTVTLYPPPPAPGGGGGGGGGGSPVYEKVME